MGIGVYFKLRDRFLILTKKSYPNRKASQLIRLSLCLFLIFSPTLSSAQIDAYKIKAVYIFRIANFVHWTDEASMESIQFCTIGNSKVTDTLKLLIKNKQVRGLDLNLEAYSRENSSRCNFLIYADNAKPTQSKEMQSPRHSIGIKSSHLNSPSTMLTISDSNGFANAKGMIELREINENIRPVVNTANIKSQHFVISSKLLRISLLIEGDD